MKRIYGCELDFGYCDIPSKELLVTFCIVSVIVILIVMFHFQVGGLEEHIKCLREMVLFPLMYPDLFKKFKTRPAKGVLFHGPPGTGKTLLARALANECSLVGGRKVAFFMRKGADCLKKWVGESERHLKLLFQQVR